jgi:glycosyltransferase involved in cell wall biosynthesis
MAAGVVPIVAGLGNLSDIVGDAGIVLPGNARQIRWQEKYIGLVLASLMSPEEREGFRLLGPKRAEEFTWDKAFVEWKAVVKEHRRAAVA